MMFFLTEELDKAEELTLCVCLTEELDRGEETLRGFISFGNKIRGNILTVCDYFIEELNKREELYQFLSHSAIR